MDQCQLELDQYEESYGQKFYFVYNFFHNGPTRASIVSFYS